MNTVSLKDSSLLSTLSALLLQQQCENRARMKRRCVPLRADHNLLTPDTHLVSGVRQHPVFPVRSESGHLTDSPSSRSAVNFPLRHPAVSPPRRLRFEDETEKQAESRYLERQLQRRRAGQQQLLRVLSCKPDVTLYVRTGAGLPGANRQQQRGVRAGQCSSCGTESGVNPRILHPTPPVAENRGRTRCRLRTETIKETYIGAVTPTDVATETSNMLVSRTNQLELNGTRGATPTTEPPINPYTPDELTTPNLKLHGRRARTEQELIKEKTDGLDLRSPNSSSPETDDPPPSGSVQQPMRAECHRDKDTPPKLFFRRDEPSRLSLRRLLSATSLSRTRSSSLDRFTPRSCPTVSNPAQLTPMNTPPKNSLSVRSLSVQESPFLHFSKSLFVQSFGSEQQQKKKKTDRSADYRPAAHCVLQRCLSVDDVGRPSALRSVGRVLQVCSDGTFLLELSRPQGESYGFIISRGRGRPDSGVYVDDMLDERTEKLYAGLLAVGDEILQVNGENISSLSLDQVTKLLTENTSTTVQVLRHWKPK